MAKETNERLARIETKLESIHDDMVEVKRLRKRVDSLDNFRSYAKGAAGIASAVLAVGVAVTIQIFRTIFHF